jgi:hypothetical protein
MEKLSEIEEQSLQQMEMDHEVGAGAWCGVGWVHAARVGLWAG